MPRIKNWNKLNDLEYEYRPNTDVTAQIYEGSDDEWYGDLLHEYEQVRNIFSHVSGKTEARETFVYWLMENPEVDIVEESSEAEPSSEKPEGACMNYNDCGNLTPGGPESNNKICDDCMEKIRGT